MTLPEVVDPSNSTVTISVKQDESFFAYDSNSETISQIKPSNSSVNQTIKVTLKNALNLTATYTL